jgi:hypothetical protein
MLVCTFQGPASGDCASAQPRRQVAHRGDRPRLVLLVDVSHPGLTVQEVAAAGVRLCVGEREQGAGGGAATVGSPATRAPRRCTSITD